MRIQRPIALLVTLLAVLWVSDTAAAQRRGSSSSSSSRQSSGSSSGSSSRSSSGGSVSRGGSSGGSVTRSSGGSSSASRSSGSVSRPPVSSGSSSSGAPSRSTTSVTRSVPDYGRPSSSSSRTDTTRPTVVTSEPRTVTRSTGSYDSGARTVDRAPTRSLDSGTTRGSSTYTSEPVRDARVIDVTDAALPPRVTFPQSSESLRRRASAGSTGSSTGDARDLTRELRSRTTLERLSEIRRETAARAPRSITTPTISRQDILDRYRGSDGAERGRPELVRDLDSSDGQRTRDDRTGAERGQDRTSDVRTERDRFERGDRISQDPRTERRTTLGRPSLSDVRRGRDEQGDVPSTADRVAAAREQRAAKDADRIAKARDDQRASKDQERIDKVREEAREKRAERIEKARDSYSRSVREKHGGGQDSTSGQHYDGGDHHDGHHDGHHDDCHDYFYWTYWGYYGPCSWGYWGWNWCGPSWCWSYWWHNYWYWGGYWYPHRRPSWYWYGPFLPWSVSVVYQTVDDGDPTVIYVEDRDPEVIYVEQPAVEGSGEVVADAPAAPGAMPVPAASGEINRAAEYYLSLGDRSFRDGRYADAVHFYARAVEFSPDEGILYLILSDALFATGDYHYAAYALRKALELDPLLTSHVVDKRSFYSDPTEFDRQIAVLEIYLEDHFVDDDARLVLAANYLFGGRPAAAVDLLENPFSAEVKNSIAGKALLDAARAIEYGGPPAPAGEAR